MKRKKNKSSKLQFQTHFHVSDGDHLKEVDPSSRDWTANDTCFFYVIAREEIEACDTTRLLHDLRTESDNPFFKLGPGNVIFSVAGYDEDPRDLLTIPEFRSFVSKVQRQAPCWLYFAMPGNEWLRIIVAASTADFRVMKMNGKLQVVVTKTQVAEFMDPQLNEYARLLEQMGIGWNGSDNHCYETMQDSFPELLAPPTLN
jgi:hypothetical protein